MKRRSLFGRLSGIVFLSIFTLTFLSGCENQALKTSDNSTPAHKSGKQTNGKAILAEPAPFDRFPQNVRSPLVFRFSQTIAPANRLSTQNFSAITLNPALPGSWQWNSDSELSFTPLDPWSPKAKFEVSLKGLTTSDGTTSQSADFTPQVFKIELPAPSVSLSDCELQIKNRSPLIQAASIGIRFNYLPDGTPANFWELKLKKGASEENLDLNYANWSNKDLAVALEGPKIFRPEVPSVLLFKVREGLRFSNGAVLEKGVSCEIPIDPKTWDAIADKSDNTASSPSLAEITVTVPTIAVIETNSNRAPLQIAFHAPWNTRAIEHGKAKGLTIDHGLTLTPAIEGTWKTDDENNAGLVFTPKSDWPVGIATTLTVDPNLFPALTLRNPTVVFTTPPIISQLSESSIYSDPKNPTDRKIVATLEFSHIPKSGDVDRLFKITSRVEPQKQFVRTLTFSVVPDEKSPRRIHIQSEKIDLADEPGEVHLELLPGLTAAQGGAPITYTTSNSISIPSKRDVFHIESASISIVKSPDLKLERVLSIATTEPVSSESLAGSLELYMLPDCLEKKNKSVCKNEDSFGDAARVFDEVLSKAEVIPFTVLPHDQALSPNFFNFGFEAPGKRELFLRVKHGLTSETKFSLNKDYRTVLYTEEFPRTLSIMHSGSLLSLSGDRNIGISLRNVPEVKFELARILAQDVHHLVSATSGNFSDPYFDYSAFGIDQFAEKFSYAALFPNRKPGEAVYGSVDFNRFMSKSKNPQGLFLLRVSEKKDKKAEEADRARKESCSNERMYDEENYNQNCDRAPVLEDKRLILLTDLGLLAKDSLSGEHEVFVISFKTGEPIAGATVKLVGQNGISLFTETSNAEGRARFPATKSLKNEKAPLLYTVEKGLDYSFLPFQRSDRRLNFSRFDTGGVVNNDEAEGLRALVFSDRGIYRPGEEARFGLMVRKRNLELAGKNLPLEISITDPRGVEIQRKKFILSELGFDDYKWNSENALTGTYSIGIYLVRGEGEDKRNLLGSASFKVDEFQPDKLNVTVRYSNKENAKHDGWYSSKGIFDVNVQNLFGTPAVSNKVTGTLLVRPWDGTFDEIPDYHFYKPRPDAELPQQAENIGEIKTDAHGLSRFNPDLSKYAERVFHLDFASEAFEKDSGRSVISSSAVLISDASYFLGWKSDGSLDFINKGAGRKISLRAINPDLKETELLGMRVELEETQMISALVKKPNGTLGYQDTPKKTTLSNQELNIALKGSELALDTSKPGSFTLKFINPRGEEINSIHYMVHGEGNTSFMADRSAEVGIQLARTSVLPGEELELSINTPYVGAGLITIEREKVYAAKWFKTDSISSIQKIKVPQDVLGNAYVSIAFVRSLDSKDIFASPLSYGTKPFVISRSRYTAGIKLQVPEKVKPGTSLPVHYTLDTKSKFLLYAVDEGILRFAHYKNPEPVQKFVPKRALEVDTYQILDLLLPDHKIVSALSSPGGDEDVGLGKFKNPFARKRRAPMAFWSGLIGGESIDGTVQIPIPEYFNGTIRIIAVAVSENKIGLEAASSIAQHDFVIDPQLPYVVSPHDEFEIGATIANTVKGSGSDVKLKISLVPGSDLEIVDANQIELIVPEGQDKAFRLKMRAGAALGEKEIQFKAEGIGREASATESISVRPPRALRTELQTGIYRPEKDGEFPEKNLSILRTVYSANREVEASISVSPLSIGRSLTAYLKSYPYGCTEQIVSSAFPAVLFGNDPELEISEKDSEKYTKRAFHTLSSRQKADGSFGLWDAVTPADPLFSVYATHFLLEAKNRGFEIPGQVLERAQKWLKDYTAEPKYDLYSQFAQSYAYYVRAVAGEVVSREAKALVSDLDRQWNKDWRNSAIAPFLAATFKQLQMDSEAMALLKRPPEIWKNNYPWPLGDAALYGSIYGWIAAKHFPEEKGLSALDTVVPIARMIEERTLSTFNGSFSIMNLKAISDTFAATDKASLKIDFLDKNNAFLPLQLFGERVMKADIAEGIQKLRYSGEKGKVFFYQLSETGFDRGDVTPVHDGLEISREFKNTKNEIKSEFQLEDKVNVTILINASELLSRMAVLELIPGGFEIDLSDDGLANRVSLESGPNTWHPDFIDVQEDRIIFFGNLPQGTATFTYRLKPLSRGHFTVPAPYAEGMYDATKRFVGTSGSIDIK